MDIDWATVGWVAYLIITSILFIFINKSEKTNESR